MINRLKTLLAHVRDKAVLNALPIALIVICGLALYLGGITIEAGLASYLASIPALLVLAVTALARVNDIKRSNVGWLWQARRVGLVAVGAAAITFLHAPLFDVTASPTWKDLLMYYGFALTWITTPNMPPWWKYVSGEVKARTTGD